MTGRNREVNGVESTELTRYMAYWPSSLKSFGHKSLSLSVEVVPKWDLHPTLKWELDLSQVFRAKVPFSVVVVGTSQSSNPTCLDQSAISATLERVRERNGFGFKALDVAMVQGES
jgi:hypothetical protein